MVMSSNSACDRDNLTDARSLIERGQWGYLTKRDILSLLADDPFHKRLFEILDGKYGFAKARSYSLNL